MILNNTKELNLLDFTPGIRAEYINENFNIIKEWIEAERIRNGGYGIVEGFGLTKDIPNLSIHIDPGVIINEEGQEIKVDEYTFKTVLPVETEMVEEIDADEDSALKLRFAAYSPKEKHTILYNPPDNDVLYEDEMRILDMDNGRYVTKANIVLIDENVIILNKNYAGRHFRVEYFYANDRIDAIMLKKDGSRYAYELGLISTSPSQQVIEDYLKNGYYFIGFAYWHVGQEIDVEFITIDRTLRPIYTSPDNKLYLNGQLYTGEKMIHFIEPEHPRENDLWYDVEEEILYIWRPDKDGNYEWRPVNDLSRFSREYGAFIPSENPEDLQTFSFKNKTNLKFIPNKNQLTIIIDQVVIMHDQYEEIYKESEYDKNAVTGVGFRLKTPLDRPSLVEVYVNRNIINSVDKEDLFQHVSAFVDTDAYVVTEECEPDHVWKCRSQYQIGNNQLDVWLDGRKLAIAHHFVECNDDGTVATIEDAGKLSTSFMLINMEPPEVGSTISYKILRQMSNYDNLRAITDALNKRVSDAVAMLESAGGNMEDVVENVNSSLVSVHNKIAENAERISILDSSKISKQDGVGIEDLNGDLAGRLIKQQICLTYSAGEVQHVVKDLDVTDVMTVYWIAEDARLILMRNVDYVVKPSSDGKAMIELKAKWMAEDAQIYIEAIKLGL